MPVDQLVYGALHGDFTALTQWSTKFSTAMLQDEEAKKKLEEAATDQAKVKYAEYLLSFALGNPDEGALRYTLVTKAEPIDSLRDLTRKTLGLLPVIEMGDIKQTTELKADAEKIGRYSADVFTTKVEMDSTKEDPFGLQKMSQAMMEAMYGPQGLEQRIVYTGDRMIQTLGGGKSSMEEALKTIDAPTAVESKSSPLLQTREALPEKVNVLAFVDVAGLLSEGYKTIANTLTKLKADTNNGPKGIIDSLPVLDDPELMNLDIKRTYAGVSVTIAKASVSSITFVPIEQAENVNKVVRLLGKLFTQLMGQNPAF